MSQTLQTAPRSARSYSEKGTVISLSDIKQTLTLGPEQIG